MLWKILGPLVVIFCVLSLSQGHGFAASTQNIGIFPSITNKSLNPGSTIEDNVGITNRGVQSYSYSVYASPYGVQNQNYQPVFKKLPGFTNISNWFSFKNPTGFLSPGETEQVSYALTVPVGTPPGSYYAALFAQTATNSKLTNAENQDILQRVGSLFYITVNGQTYEKGSIYSWHVPFFQSSAVKGSLKLENSGKLYFVSTININFEDILGNVKYQYQNQKIVIPKVIRNIQVVWPKPPAFGVYKVKGTATVYGKKYLTTRYVLIVSPTLRLVFIFIVAAIIIYKSIRNILINIFEGRKKAKK